MSAGLREILAYALRKQSLGRLRVATVQASDLLRKCSPKTPGDEGSSWTKCGSADLASACPWGTAPQSSHLEARGLSIRQSLGVCVYAGEEGDLLGISGPGSSHGLRAILWGGELCAHNSCHSGGDGWSDQMQEAGWGTVGC